MLLELYMPQQSRTVDVSRTRDVRVPGSIIISTILKYSNQRLMTSIENKSGVMYRLTNSEASVFLDDNQICMIVTAVDVCENDSRVFDVEHLYYLVTPHGTGWVEANEEERS